MPGNLTVFYDGSCAVCATAIARYRGKCRSDEVCFVDVSAPGFDPSRYGRTAESFMAQVHVRDAAGAWYAGVDALSQLWQVLPGCGYRLLGTLLQVPGIHGAARIGYGLFARHRRSFF